MRILPGYSGYKVVSCRRPDHVNCCKGARVHRDERTGDEAIPVLDVSGFTGLDALCSMMIRIVAEKRLRFESVVPTGEIITVMRTARCMCLLVMLVC